MLDEDVKCSCYLDTPAGLIKHELNHEEWLDVSDIYAAWMDDNRHEYEVYSLVLKQNAKELDPRYFNAREQAQFNEADEAEWRQWINNGVITTVEKRTEKDIPSNKIITAPMRMVRVNKRDDTST